MIPEIEFLTDNGNTYSGNSYGSFDVSSGGSVTRYLVFDYLGTDTDFTIRLRTRTRSTATQELSEWGEWTIFADQGITAQENSTRHIWNHALTYNTSTVSPTGASDYAEIEMQIRSDASTETEEESYSAPWVFPIRCAPELDVSFWRASTAEYRLQAETDWTHNDNSIILDGIWKGTQATGTLLTTQRNVWYSEIVKNGWASILSTRFKTLPQNNDSLTIAGIYETSDGAQVPFTKTMTFQVSLCNTPELTVEPHPELGVIDFTVTDKGDRGVPLKSASIHLSVSVDSDSTPDVLNAPIGQKVHANLPPLDTTINANVTGMSASGAYSTITRALSLPSEGRAWFNWGSGYAKRLALEMNLDWGSAFENPKSYFKRASGLPAVFFSKNRSQTGSVSGDIFYPSARSTLQELANTIETVVFRGPYGEKAIVVIDTLSMSDPAASIVTEVSVEMTRVG